MINLWLKLIYTLLKQHCTVLLTQMKKILGKQGQPVGTKEFSWAKASQEFSPTKIPFDVPTGCPCSPKAHELSSTNYDTHISERVWPFSYLVCFAATLQWWSPASEPQEAWQQQEQLSARFPFLHRFLWMKCNTIKAYLMYGIILSHAMLMSLQETLDMTLSRPWN